MSDSAIIIKRLSKLSPHAIDLSLNRIIGLLKKLNNPHFHLPKTIHLAGTNGKGSIQAYLRRIYECANLQVHTFTSPHLVKFHERIILAGKIISEEYLCALLEEVEYANNGEFITLFEITQAAAFLAFSRISADLLILETGLGGRLDASNVIKNPLITVITPISLDHQEFLGHTIEKIAFEKACIMKPDTISVIAPQSETVLKILNQYAYKIKATIFNDFCILKKYKNSFFVRISDEKFNLPLPNLIGDHQLTNALTAITTIRKAALPNFKGDNLNIIAKGLQSVRWPGRLQKIEYGPLLQYIPHGCNLFIDGGHNISAAKAIVEWISHRKIHNRLVIMGMTINRNPSIFLEPMIPYIDLFCGISIGKDYKSHSPEILKKIASGYGISKSYAFNTVKEILIALMKKGEIFQEVLIIGSLYLAGHILKNHS